MFKKTKKDVDKFHFGLFTIERDRHINRISMVRVLGLPFYIDRLTPFGYKRKLFGINIKPRKITFGNKIPDVTQLDNSKIEQSQERINDLNACHTILSLSQKKIACSNYISLIGSPSGEIYLFLSLLKQFLAKEDISDYVLIVNSEWKRRLCLFLSPESRCFKIDCDLFIHDVLKYKEGTASLFNVFPTTHYIRQDQLIVSERTHYYNQICHTLGLYKEKVLKPSVTKDTKDKILKLFSEKKVDLSSVIILCPEANSCSELSKAFWEELSVDLMTRGYYVFLNSSNPKYVSCSDSVFLTHEELYCLSQHVFAVVGLRSGLIEILASSGARIFAFYGGFPQRGILEAMSADDVLGGFSLKKLPGLPNSKIFEYSLTHFNCKKLIKDLRTKLPTRNKESTK